MHQLDRHQWVPSPVDETFEFFSKAENLERLTPAWLGFEILTPTPIPMQSGTLIDYRIRLFGVPMRWKTRIEDWSPGSHFVDTQLRGPYRLWEHTHSFRAMDGGTLITDRVRYQLPFGFLGRIVHALFVRSTVARIFDHRFDMISEALGGPSTQSPQAVTPGGFQSAEAG